MKVVKSTGLVPVYTAAYAKRIFGVTPAVARDLLSKGEIFLADIPDTIETVDIAEPAPKEPEKVILPDLIDIPEDWESLHHLKKIKLAKDLVPEADVKWTVDLAEAEIKRELERRSAE